jgi:hypothetical protein
MNKLKQINNIFAFEGNNSKKKYKTIFQNYEYSIMTG